MSRTSGPTITLVPPPGLAPRKMPSEFDMTLFPSIISAVIFGAISFATVWLHNSKKEVLLPDEYDQDIYDGAGSEDLEMHGAMPPQDPPGDSSQLQAGPEYADSVVPPNRAFVAQASKQPFDWSHTISTDDKHLRGSADNSGPPSGFSYTPHTSPPTSGISSRQHIAKEPVPTSSPTRPTPALAAYPEQPRSPATLKAAAWPVPGVPGAWKAAGAETVCTDLTLTATDEPSQLTLDPEYVGSEVTGLEQGRALSEDYTAILKTY